MELDDKVKIPSYGDDFADDFVNGVETISPVKTTPRMRMFYQISDVTSTTPETVRRKAHQL